MRGCFFGGCLTIAGIFLLMAVGAFAMAAFTGKTYYVLVGFSRLCSLPVIAAGLLLLYRSARRRELSASRR